MIKPLANRLLKFILLHFFLVIALFKLEASHIAAGDFTYAYVSKSGGFTKYHVTLTVFRDCNSIANFPSAANVNIGVYDASNNSQYGTYTLDTTTAYKKANGGPKKVTPTCIPSSNICLEAMSYEKDINIPSSKSYIVTAGVGNRASGITNLSSASTYGMGWVMNIPASSSYTNNSPKFSSQPLGFACQNDTFSFNQNGYDPDGDSLVFAFADPYKSSGAGNIAPIAPGSLQTVSWNSGYDYTYFLGSTSLASINSQTGELTMCGKTQGVFVVDIEVTEYRRLANGTLVNLGKSRRNFQVTIVNCSGQNTTKPIIYKTGLSDSLYYNRTVTIGDSLWFNVTVYDTLGDSLYVSANGAIFSDDGQCASFAYLPAKGGDSTITTRFSWNPGCCRVGKTVVFTVDFQVFRTSSCFTIQKTYTIKVLPMTAAVSPKFRGCDIQSNTQIKLQWVIPSDTSKLKKYYIYRRPVGGNFALIDSVTKLKTDTFTDKNVTNTLTTQYEYMIRPVNQCDSLAPGDTVRSIVLALSKIYNYRADLTWNHPGKTWVPYRYYIYRNSSSGGWKLINTVKSNADTSSYAEKCEDSVWYYVIGVDSATGAKSSSMISSKDLLVDVIPPIIMGYRRVTVTSDNQIMLEWNQNDSEDVIFYELYKGTVKGTFSIYDTIYSDGSAVYAYFDTVEQINAKIQPAYYKIRAVDSCGNYGSFYEEHSPVNVRGKNGNNQNTLFWRNYEGFPTDTIIVLRSINGGNFSEHAYIVHNDTNDTMFVDAGLICSQKYTYILQYRSNYNHDIIAESDTVQLVPYDTIPPLPPSIKNVTVLNNTSVQLTFENSPSSDVNRYVLYRATNGGSFVPFDTIFYPATLQTTIKDSGLNTLQNKYCYHLRAIDSCYNLISEPSVQHCAVQLSAIAGNNRIYINWSKYQGYKVGYYNIKRFENGGWLAIDVLNGTDSTYIDSVGINCINNSYIIEEKSDTGNFVSYSDTVVISPIDTISPNPPTIKYVTIVNHHRIDIHWLQTSTDVDKIILYRGIDDGSMTAYDTLSSLDTSYIDNNVSADLYYYNYALEAIDSCVKNSSGIVPHHRSINITRIIDYCNRKSNLSWNTYTGWPNGVASYELYRSINGGAFSLHTTLTKFDSSFADTNSAFILYTYRIKAIEQGGNEVSWSDSVQSDFSLIRGPVVHSVSKTATSSTNGAVTITWNALELDQFVKRSKLYYSSTGASGSYTLLKDSLPVTQTSYIHSNINTSTADHWYYMINVDSCDDVTDSTGIHHSCNLSVNPKKIRNKLYWTRYAGWPKLSGYIIERKDSTTGNFVSKDTVSSADTAYTDFPSPCNGYVSYRISAYTDSVNTYISYSDSVTIPPLDTIATDTASLKNVSVIANGVIEVTFYGIDSSDVYGYLIKRQDSNGAWKSIKFVNFYQPGYTYTYDDSTANTQSGLYTYQVFVVDSCLNAAPSREFKQVQLTATPGHLKNYIKWTTFLGYQILQYNILVLDDYGNWGLLDTVLPSDTTYFHDKLTCNKNYTYQVVAVSTNGIYASLSDTAIAAPFDSIPPVQDSLIYVTVASDTSVEVQWSKSSPDVGYFKIKVESQFGWTKIYTASKDDTIAIIDGLNTQDSIYEVTVTAYDSCSNNASSASVPHKTSNVTGASFNNAVFLSWNLYSGFKSSVDKQVIEIWKNGWVPYKNLLPNDTSFLDTGLGCNQLYAYRKYTHTTDNRVSYSDSVGVIPFDTIKPQTPVLNVVTIATNNIAQLNWTKSVSPDVKYYEVWRIDNKAVANKMADLNDVNTWTDSTIDAINNIYGYYIIAIDSCNTNNRSTPSDTMYHASLSYSYQACLVRVNLTWELYNRFLSGNSIQKITRSDSNGNTIASWNLNPSQKTYTDTNVLEGILYRYVITTYDSSGLFQSNSDTLYVRPYIYPLPVQAQIKVASVNASSTSLGKIRIDWSRNPIADTLARGYILYHSTTSANTGFSQVAKFSNLNDTTYIHDSLNTATGRNWYKVSIYDLCDREGLLSSPHSPVNLTVTAENLQNTLAWTRYEGWPVAIYNIEKTDSRGHIDLISASLDSSYQTFIDTNASCDVLYSYRINSVEYSLTPQFSYSDADSALTFDTIPPNAVPIRVASVNVSSNASAGSIILTFSAASEKNRNGYNIYRADDGVNFNFLATVLNSLTGYIQFTDANISTQDIAYSYYVTATDSCGNESAPSDTHTVMNLTAIAINSAVDLTWSKYIHFNEPFNYIIDRLQNNGSSTWQQIAIISSDSLHYLDSFVVCNTLYSYRINAISASNIISLSDTEMVLTYDTSAPMPAKMRRVTVVSSNDINGGMKVEWTHSPSKDVASYTIYRRLKDDIIWENIGTVGYATEFTDFGINTLDTVYFYQVAAMDSCLNISGVSDEHGSIRLITAPGEQQINLYWNAYSGNNIATYRIYRDDILYASVDGNTFNFMDTPLTCTQHMTYQIEAVMGDDTLITSRSDSSLNTAVDHTSPTVVYLKYATVSTPNSEVKLEWTKSNGFDVAYYEIYRKYNGTNSWVKIKKTDQADTFFIDHVNYIDRSLCYRIVASDSCSNTSGPSNEACIVFLEGQVDVYRHDISFTPYTLWQADVKKYELWRNEDGAGYRLLKTYNKIDTPYTYVDTILTYNIKEFCYKVVAYENEGSFDGGSVSNEVCLIQQPIYWIPNSFSPNDDGLNDVFMPGGIYYDKYDLTIYDRWGGIVFQSTDQVKTWDGNDTRGRAMQGDSYMYKIKIYSYDRREYNAYGTITLLK
jgi:gliding motility-associated-like protein